MNSKLFSDKRYDPNKDAKAVRFHQQLAITLLGLYDLDTDSNVINCSWRLLLSHNHLQLTS